MEIHDSVAERRNLIVMSLAIIVYYWAGGSVVDQKLKLPMVNMEFSEPVVLFIFVWVLFIYFIFRYRVTSKGFGEDAVRHNMKHEFFQLSINKKHHAYLYGELKKTVPAGGITGLDFRRWTLYYGNKIMFDGHAENISKRIDVKGFRDRWIAFGILIKAYFKYPNANAYYTPYILAWVAFFTLGYNTYLKICAEILKKSAS